MENSTTSSASPGASAELVRRILAGDLPAEAELVAHFSRGLSLMLRRLTGDPALADDLLQDTLALVLTKIRHGEVREPERLAGFVRSLARNLWIADRARELPRRAVFLLLLAVVETDQPLVHPLGSEG